MIFRLALNHKTSDNKLALEFTSLAVSKVKRNQIFALVLIFLMTIIVAAEIFESGIVFKPIKRSWNTIIAGYRSIATSQEFSLSETNFSNLISRKSDIDGMIQLYVPAGEFSMGQNDGRGSDHAPQHQVYLDDYWIDAFEVNNDQYRICVEAGACSAPEDINWMFDLTLFDKHPVVYVTWYQAVEYCAWAERRLPTEAEWEKAAQGPVQTKYPWGNDKPNSHLANFGNGVGLPITAASYPDGASGYGPLNMVGNVREWVSDWYNPTYYQRSPFENPSGAPQGAARSLRGGGFSDPIDRLMVYNRFSHDPESPGINRGFRCAAD